MSRSPIPFIGGKAACRMEVLGKVASLSLDPRARCCLATTILNGAHVFHTDEDSCEGSLYAGMSASRVESYPYNVFGKEPLLCGCFVGDGQSICVGSAGGSVMTVSRRSRCITGSFLFSAGNRERGQIGEDSGDVRRLPVRGLAAMPDQASSAVLACTEETTAVVDVERSVMLYCLVNPVPRAVGAVPLSPSTFVTANYDGKALLYDVRESLEPAVVLSVPDQVSCIACCPDTAQVCVGTVAGRVFTMRCTESAMREQAFGTGKRRSPIRSVAVFHQRIVAGDISGKLTILDASDTSRRTRYWTADDLLGRGTNEEDADGVGSTNPHTDGGGAVPASKQSEVASVALAKGFVWAAFSSPDSLYSHAVALPED